MKLKQLLGPIAAFLLALNISGVALAISGTESGGGGDPDAADFLLQMKTFSSWVESDYSSLTPPQVDEISKTVSYFSNAIENPDQTPVRFTEEMLRDESGSEKVALFFKNPTYIRVNRILWKAQTLKEKQVTAALELMGLAEIKNRYTLAPQLIETMNQKFFDSASCQDQVEYLETSMREFDSAKCDDAASSAEYVSNISAIMNSWMESFGYNCLPQAGKACIRKCLPKAKGACMNVCNPPG